MPPQVHRGVLITSDEASITFITWLDEQAGAHGRFVLAKLDARNVFVKEERVRWVQRMLQKRLLETTFDEDEEAGQPVSAHP
jgi:hypothetical protein